MKCPVGWFGVSAGLGMAVGSPSFNIQCCLLIFWRISMVYLALELAVSWVELGFSIGMDTFG